MNQLSEQRYLLVMTATIIPAPSAKVARADPQLRIEDYKNALRYWLKFEHPVAERILFLENSGADLNQLRAIANQENPLNKEVEFLSVSEIQIPAGRNYGYAEMRMLDEGLSLSQLRAKTTHLIKVTGRLTFPALGKAVDLAPKPFDAMIDCRKLGFPRKGYDAITQVCYFSHSFYDRALRGSCVAMNDSDVRLLEHLIYRQVSAYQGQSGILLRFLCNVDPIGHSGFSNRSYGSLSQSLTSSVRALLRVIVPNYWF